MPVIYSTYIESWTTFNAEVERNVPTRLWLPAETESAAKENLTTRRREFYTRLDDD